MNFIVDSMICLLSAKTMFLCPYKNKCDWLITISRLYFSRIAVTLAIRVAL